MIVFVAVFIYSMPGSSCRIKERMLYSSCKSRLLEDVAKDYHLEVAKKVTDEKKASHWGRPMELMKQVFPVV